MKVRDDVTAPAATLIARIRRSAVASHWLEAALAGLAGFLTIYALAEATATLGALLLIAPFGASCVLVFTLPSSPLAQPRNVIGGHVLSTAIGLCVLSLMGTSPAALAMGVGLSISAMSLTRSCIRRPAPIRSSSSWLGRPGISCSCRCWRERWPSWQSPPPFGAGPTR